MGAIVPRVEKAETSLAETASQLPSTLRGRQLRVVREEIQEGAPGLPVGSERYRIEQELGSGGMASVYRAFDRQLERPVALKLIRRSLPSLTAPVLNEARAQARVRHDNVLEVYEAGEFEGRPYIAMRYVDGPTLLELGGLPLEAKLRLLWQVAEGLHAAHRAGLLHRDVKPSNVLVEEQADGELKPYVSDFGIATALENEAAGAVVLAGTPAFMSPESLRGGASALDRRSDVYSFGLTMLQLLCGQLPARGESADVLMTSLPVDVAAIIRKCIAENPAERYPSALAVAVDLRRFLDGEVVEAHAAGLAYRLTKFSLRYRLLLRVAGAAAVLVIAALVVAAVLGLEAIRANQLAETRRGQAEDLIGFMLGELRTKVAPSSKLSVLDDIGKKALEYFAAVPKNELSDVELANRARALYQIADVRISQGDLEGAKRPLAEALALAKELVDREPGVVGPLFELGQIYFWVGHVDWNQGRLESAKENFESYLEVANRLVAMAPGNLDYELEVFFAQSNLSYVQEAAGTLKAAIATRAEALTVIEKLVAGSPGRADWQFELAATHNAMGVLQRATGQYEEALAHFQADRELRQRLVEADPKNLRSSEFLAVADVYVSSGLLPLGRPGEAREHALAAIRRFQNLVVSDPQNAVRRLRLSIAYFQLGRVELALGAPESAASAFGRQVEILEEMIDSGAGSEEHKRNLGMAHYHLALAWVGRDGAVAGAEALRAVVILEDTASESEARLRRRWVANSLMLLGMLDAAQGRNELARQKFEQAGERLGPEAALAEDLELCASYLRAQRHLGNSEAASAAKARLEAKGYREGGFADPVLIYTVSPSASIAPG